MLAAAYIQFGNQFLPHESGYVYYRRSYATQQRLDPPVKVSQAEADAFANSFKRSARAIFAATLLLFAVLLVGFAFVSEEGGAVVVGFVLVVVSLLLGCAVLTARAWSRPARLLAGRPKLSPDPYPVERS
jgi:peptidoglycan/LPS O-acetylase OafA/YrhL